METYATAHLLIATDERGDVVDVVPFCSDWCHRDYCSTNGREYAGWNGCHEVPAPYLCGSCGAWSDLGDDEVGEWSDVPAIWADSQA